MRKLLIGALTFIAIVISVSSAAETLPEDSAKYRGYIMKALSGHNGAISMMARNKAGDASRVAMHASALVNLAAEVEAVFPEGSAIEGSESKPEIWEHPEEFADAIAELVAAIDALNDVAGDGDMTAINAAHRDVSKACKGCHERFRIDDD